MILNKFFLYISIDDMLFACEHRCMSKSQTSEHNSLPKAPILFAVPSLAWSLESEKSLICACLLETRGDIVREISAQLMSTDFYEEAHQNIWRCRSSLADAGVAHDVAAVVDSAGRLGLFLGGIEYVMELLHDEVLKTNSDLAIRAASKRVKDFSILRTFTQTLETALALSNTGQSTHEELIDYVGDSIENIRATAETGTTGPMPVMHYVAAVCDQIEMRLGGEEPGNTVTTGFFGLDKLTGGMTEGDLIILAARPSMGKTAVSLAIAEAAAEIGARHVLLFSTEQGGTALAYRMIASKARVDATNMRRGELSKTDLDRVFEGASAIGNLSVYIDETSEISLPEIRARSRIFAKTHGKVLIVIDYLQRLKAHREADPRIIVGEISTGLKNLAKELKCPILALAQLNRGVEARANKRPMMSDLGESGKIEQDADIILFLYRDEYYNPDTKEPGVTEVIVAKNRDGGIGVSKLASDKRTQHYEEIYLGR